ncbi:TetR/AcrR family transcriptional regulator [Nonomuraea sp. NPDC046570]|uniref:TetR/AcrR family transcriptional regulator n=1 Tax=Nonomuraea sp. NPDC046570 TaxID=3155255 RepID=UPI0034045948
MAPLDPGRERAILDATLALLSEMGYDRMSVDQIARRARASKATIYRRWAGKAELVVDVICRRLHLDAPAPADTGSLRGDLLVVFAGLCEAFAGRHTLIMGLSPALVSSPELAGALREHMPSGGLPGMAEVLDRASARGELTGPVDPGRVLSLAEALVFRQMIFVGPPFGDDFVTSCIDEILLPLVGVWQAVGRR